MIKVALYEFSYEWTNDEPSKVLSLKKFEEMLNKDRVNLMDYYRIQFIVE